MKYYRILSLLIAICLIGAVIIGCNRAPEVTEPSESSEESTQASIPEETLTPPEQITGDAEFEAQYPGTQSKILDYATGALRRMNAQGVTLVHARSGYVYENGERILKTSEEIDAILKKAEGKVITKDETGLIAISAEPTEITDSLRKFMLYTRPTAEDIKELFQTVNGNVHPRIAMTPEKMDRIISDHKAGKGFIKTWGDAVIQSADKHIQGAHVKYLKDDGSKTTAFDRILRSGFFLSMAYRLTEDQKYLDYLWEDLQLAGNFPEWYVKFQFLDTAEFCAGFAVAYDWLYDVWTDEQKQFLEESMLKLGVHMEHRYLYNLEKYPGTFVTSPTNRNAVCNGGAGMAAIAIFDKYPDKCADVLEKAYHALEIMLKEYAPDGADTEGPAYWEYAMRAFSLFMETTQNVFGTDFNLCMAPGFDKTGEYYLNIDGMTGSNNFHDSTNSVPLTHPAIFWYADALDQPELAEILLTKIAKHPLKDFECVVALALFDPDTQVATDITWPLDAYFRKMELASLRSSWTDDKGIFVSMHTGTTDISHAHMDSGSFVLDIGGQRFAGEIGKEDYSLFNDLENKTDKYYYYRYSPEGHNLFVINPDTRHGQTPIGSETIEAVVTGEKESYIVAPLNTYYNDFGHLAFAQETVRGIKLGDERNSVLIRDEIRDMEKAENEVHWYMQMQNVQVEIAADKKSAILRKGGVAVHLQVYSDNAEDFEIMVTKPEVLHPAPVMGDRYSKQRENTGWQRLAIVFKAGKDLNINVKMAKLNDPLGDTPIVDIPIAQWGENQ